jgi:hypothetical protein
MAQPSAAPAIWLICPDEPLRGRVARGLRVDGMNVVEFAWVEAAVAAHQGGARPAIALIQTFTELELAESLDGLRAGPTPPEIVILGEVPDSFVVPAAAHRFHGEINVWRLSRFLRLVVARPSLRSALQASYRLAHEQTPPLTEVVG